MTTEPVSVVLSDDAAEAVRREVARTGLSETEVVETAVLRLTAPSILDQLQARATLTEDEAMILAVEEQRAARAERRAG